MQMFMFRRWKAFHALSDVLAGLESASGFIRRTLASRVELRAFPRLRFHWDMTPENADHIEKILAELRKKK